jgi:hypothetical protein
LPELPKVPRIAESEHVNRRQIMDAQLFNLKFGNFGGFGNSQGPIL